MTLRATEADWECAYRVFKYCAPHDHTAATRVVSEYRAMWTVGMILKIETAYRLGNIHELLKELRAD